MKVLLSAYACRPNRGSEPGVGWNVVQQMTKYHQIWAITREDNRPSIEAELAKHPNPNLQFVYYDFPSWAIWWNKEQRGLQLHYYLWQIGIYFVVKKLHREINFDLMHHVTYVKYWSPSFIAFLPIPFLWGPVGGGESAPQAFWKTFTLKQKGYETLRNIARWLGEHDWFVQQTAKRSILALATTKETAERLEVIHAGKVDINGECALSSQEIEQLGDLPKPPDFPIRFISIGRLLHWKGFSLGLQAFALAKLNEAEYWIVGDGPELHQLQQKAKELGIASQVKFWGKLPRAETFKKLADCHVLVHPSLHDSGGWVSVEAMAAGKPVVCLDLGGPATQVTEETGFKVAANEIIDTVSKLADAMTYLSKEPEIRLRMGLAAKSRIKELYNWDYKGKLFADIYQEIPEKLSK